MASISNHKLQKKYAALLHVAKLLLRSMGQIMLQRNALTGCMFLLGVAIGSLPMGVAMVVATWTAYATARLIGFDKNAFQEGMFGFSAALVGAAFVLFFKPGVVLWMALVMAAAVATILQHIFIRLRIPVFTLPFVLVAWGCIYLLPAVTPLTLKVSEAMPIAQEIDVAYPLRGYGQVIFQDKLIPGVLLLLGVLVASPWAALMGIMAAVFSGWVSYGLLGANLSSLNMGLLSYNAVLCAITFTDTSSKWLLWVFLSVMLCIGIEWLMRFTMLPPLTFPFVLASILTTLIKNKRKEKN